MRSIRLIIISHNKSKLNLQNFKSTFEKKRGLLSELNANWINNDVDGGYSIHYFYFIHIFTLNYFFISKKKRRKRNKIASITSEHQAGQSRSGIE